LGAIYDFLANQDNFFGSHHRFLVKAQEVSTKNILHSPVLATWFICQVIECFWREFRQPFYLPHSLGRL